MKTVATLAIAALLTLVSPQFARADTLTDDWVSKRGQQVCNVLEVDGISSETIRSMGGQLQGMGFSRDQAVTILADSVTLFCPEKWPAIEALANGKAPSKAGKGREV